LLGKVLTEKIKVLKYLIFLSLPMTLAGLNQFIMRVQSSNIWVSAKEVGTNRVFAFLGSPNVLGVLLALVALLSLGIFLEEKKKLFLIISLMNVFVVGLTLSRSAWLGLIFGIGAALVLWNYKYLFLAPLTFVFLVIPQVRRRIVAATTPEYFLDSTLDGRIWSFINGAHILKQKPIFGTGPGTYGGQLAVNYASPIYLKSIQNGYTALYYTDNQYLELLVQTGVLGFLAFLGLVISVIVELIEKFKVKHSKITLAVFACFVCFLVASFFANNLEFTAVAMPMALMLGVEND
jgi:O-antigen ligase